MTRIVIDAATLSKLQNCSQTIELCDEAGHVLGRFIPSFDPALWEPMTPEITPEELRRRRQSNEKRYTTAEVLESLEKL